MNATDTYAALPHNEPEGEGNGWYECPPDIATVWLVENMDDPLAYAEAAFETYAEAKIYIDQRHSG